MKHVNNPKNFMSVATKIAIQIACKVGGAPWSVGIPVTVSSGRSGQFESEGKIPEQLAKRMEMIR